MISHAMNARHTDVATSVAAEASGESAPWLPAKGMRTSAVRDSVLFREGDEARSCYRIQSGAIRVVKVLADGRRYVADFFLPGDVVGFDCGDTYEYTAEAIVDTELVRYPRPLIEARFEENPAAGRRLLDVTLQRLAAAQSQMLLLGRMNAMERVATFLLNLERRLGAKESVDRTIPLAMTRADIADHLGLTLETVSRMLNQLKRDGTIGLPDPHRISVLKPQRLERMACAGGH
ncbi:MAG: helix-turn-helix domain-containing protein [Alphaproteobacteria bacterium]|nr:helix-turn-helix domain-containing protein [Alphaproteobacteria bacterium]